MILGNVIRKGIFGRILNTNRIKNKDRKPGSQNNRNQDSWEQGFNNSNSNNSNSSNSSLDLLEEYYVTGITLNHLQE